MNSRAWIRIAGIVVSLTIAAVLAVAVPHPLWNSSTVVAATFLVLTVCTPLLLPTPQPQVRSGSDATAIWLIGPMFLWVALLFVLGAVALWLGLAGSLTLCWMLDVAWLGALGAGWAALRASTGVVAFAAVQVISASDDARTGWLSLLKVQALNSENESCKRILSDMAERIRYAANNNATSKEHVAAINEVLASIEPTVNQPEGLRRVARAFEGLLEQRELSIRASRTRA